MGEVYCGRDTRLERAVAVKILPSHLSDAVGFDSAARTARFAVRPRMVIQLLLYSG